jgi:hypothetical protein
MVGIAPVRGQEPKRPGLTGKWQLRTQNDKGKEGISTLDLIESGSSLVGTVTPLNGRAMSISERLLCWRCDQDLSLWKAWPVFNVDRDFRARRGRQNALECEKGKWHDISCYCRAHAYERAKVDHHSRIMAEHAAPTTSLSGPADLCAWNRTLQP